MATPLAEDILRRLLEARGSPVSGQDLARTLGVTRAGVWKAVAALRRQGLGIQSLPARGYRLDSSGRRLEPAAIAAGLATRRIGRAVRHFAQTASTNRDAEAWALEGAPDGALVVADHQTAGRGRLGRAWLDAPGHSLLLSLVLRPPVPAADAPSLTFVAAVALAEALARWIPPCEVTIKWPNDVLVAGRKVAGILLEMRSEGQRVEHVILGIGVNVGSQGEALPPDVRSLATAVETHSGPARPDRLELLWALLASFEATYDAFLADGFPPIQARWDGWANLGGRWLAVFTPGGPVEGRALGLTPRGALLLEDEAGARREVYAGDVAWTTTRNP